LRAEGLSVCGVLAICDRLAGGAGAIENAAGAPFVALSTIDEVYPQRPDRDV
jgi:orotate phosphoribosyltransferase